MGYKRTSKKTGPRYHTKTVNTNGNVTESFSDGSKNFRTTYTYSSKNGNRVTQTYRDGAGFTHKKTIFRSETPADKRRKHKENEELGRTIAAVFILLFKVIAFPFKLLFRKR